jgi:acyl-CoA hydrolase
MVALDPEGRPCAVPKLAIRTEDEFRRHRDAEERRAARLELANRRRVRRERKSSDV